VPGRLVCPTETNALLPGSVAIDVIPEAACVDADGEPLTTDQRGEPRPEAGGSMCDVGAFELGGTGGTTGTGGVGGGTGGTTGTGGVGGGTGGTGGSPGNFFQQLARLFGIGF